MNVYVLECDNGEEFDDHQRWLVGVFSTEEKVLERLKLIQDWRLEQERLELENWNRWQALGTVIPYERLPSCFNEYDLGTGSHDNKHYYDYYSVEVDE